MKVKERIRYWALCGVAYPLSLLPLRGHYVFSDILAFFAGRVVKYRRRVLDRNLSESFPDMPRGERRRLEKEFYRWLCDYFFETLKLLTMSERQLRRRLVIENQEMLDEALLEGRSVVMYLGHYANWEWVSALPLVLPRESVPSQAYHPLKNKWMDAFMKRIRTRFGANNVPMKEIGLRLLKWKRAGKACVTGLIADQYPGLTMHHFCNFLNHPDTYVITGPERLARVMDARVVYVHMERTKRGYYRMRYQLITDRPKEEPLFALTDRYFELLEANIRENPAHWLWTHKRWKRTRAEYEARWGDKTSEMLSHL